MSAADRDRIVELLRRPDAFRSERFRARRDIRDWTIRKIARELDGDPRPMRQRAIDRTRTARGDFSRWPAGSSSAASSRVRRARDLGRRCAGAAARTVTLFPPVLIHSIRTT